MTIRTQVSALLTSLTLALVVVFGSPGHASANTYASGWSYWNTQCEAYWDANVGTYTIIGCADRPDGGFSIWVNLTGTWLYVGGLGTLDNGVTWIEVDGQVTYSEDFVNDPLYGMNTSIGAPTNSVLTGNPIVDQMIINHNGNLGDIQFQQHCVMVIADICYTN